MDGWKVQILLFPQLLPAEQVVQLLESEQAAFDFVEADRFVDLRFDAVQFAQSDQDRVCLLFVVSNSSGIACNRTLTSAGDIHSRSRRIG